MNDKSNDNMTDTLDSAVDAIQAERPSAADIEAAANRVRTILAKSNATAFVAADQASFASGAQTGREHITREKENSREKEHMENTRQLSSTASYIAAIPDYLAQRLSPAQKLLFEEESRQSIPLRRALNDAKVPVKPQSHRRTRQPRRWRWLASAAAVLIVASFVLIAPQLPSLNQSQLAQVEDVSGSLYQLIDGGLQELKSGVWIDGQQELRTAHNGTAMLVLDDGSRIEVSPRTELHFTRRGRGNRIDVNRGKIIVAASPQGSGTLDVATNEFVVSVTGTIFEVGHGANGSRVSVIEGEVQVHQEGDSTSLMPGEQFASRMGKSLLGIEDDIAWSRNADDYIAMLREVSALQQDLQAAMSTSPRYSARLLNLVPENTIVYGAVPNAPEKIAEIYGVIRDRIQYSDNLSRAFANLEMDVEFQQLEQVMTWLAEVGDTLGDENVAALTLRGDGATHELAPLILSEVDAEAFRASFETQLARLSQHAGSGNDDQASDQQTTHQQKINIALINDPAEALPNQLSIWLHDDLLVASTNVEVLQAVETAIANQGSAFIGSGLHTQLLNFYNNGAEFLGAVDLESIIALESSDSGLPATALAGVGIQNAQYLMVHHSQQDGRANFTADLIFNGERSGFMSWLAQPASMGALDFFSSNTTFVTAFILISPAEIYNEMKRLVEQQTGASWESMHSDAGSDTDSDAAIARELRDNFIAALGGEAAIGMDGPALPTPSWKVVMEVYDEVLLQETLARAVDYANQLVDSGSAVAMTSTNVGAYTAYQLQVPAKIELADNDIETDIRFIYTYVDGYFIAAPNAALLERAINQYYSGVGLLADAEFQSLLPQGGYLDVSALSFNRIGQLLFDLTKNLPSGLTPEQRHTLREFRIDNRGASMINVIAEPESIRVVHSGNSMLPLNISSILSLQSVAGILIGEDQLIEIINEIEELPDAVF